MRSGEQIEAELKALEALLKSATPIEVRKVARARFIDLTNKDERSEQL